MLLPNRQGQKQYQVFFPKDGVTFLVLPSKLAPHGLSTAGFSSTSASA